MNIDKKFEENDNKSNLEMGLKYSKDKSTFRVFSPPNDNLLLRIYENPYSIVGKDYKMEKNEFGIFEIEIKENLEGKFYTYITDDNLEVSDPYSFACSVNSSKTAIIDLDKTNPEGFKSHNIPKTKPSEAILYEMHIKDFTYHESSGVINRGKYLGAIEKDTNYKGVSTSLDHLIELGVTHVHLLPIYDYLTVNEYEDYFHIDENYNWGYDPELFNVPEGSYSTIPTLPENRIYELKKLIQTLHENGIKVIMDVVYNHVFRGENSNLETLYPGYYLRRRKNNSLSDGAGVGTEMASERFMYRKFIVDSIKYWMEEYKIDGFRFDLMGLIDIDTMEEVVKTAKSIDENSLIYGEPWTGGATTLPYNKMTLKGSQYGKGFACFNDTFRDCIKGDNNGRTLGFAMGDFNKKICVETGITGSIDFDSLHYGFTKSPQETINYSNSHDDLILTDKINLAMRNSSIEDRIDINKLTHSLVLLSFGIPFIHAGNEFLRSKRGIRNTYNSPVSINNIDWSLKYENINYYNYIKDLFELRKSIKAFSEYDEQDIVENLEFLDFHTKPVIGYTLKYHNELYIVFFNSGHTEEKIKIDEIFMKVYEKNENKFNKNEHELYKIFNKQGIIKNIVSYSEKDLTINSMGIEVYKIKNKE